MESEPDLLENFLIRGDTWIFQYDTETKKESMRWKTSASSEIKKLNEQIKTESHVNRTC